MRFNMEKTPTQAPHAPAPQPIVLSKPISENMELIKASAAIQITNRLSLLQRKLGNALLKHAFNRLEESETHSININLLAERVGFESKNVEVLKEALTNLAKTSVEFNLLGKDKRPIWGISTVLSQAIIRDGVLFYAYPPFMRRALRHPDIYAKLNLTVQNGFRSKHALALWEFFTDYLGSKRDKCQTDFISIEQYRSLLGIDDNDYLDFRDFNKRLIKQPIMEINEVSDILVELPPLFKRSRRRIESMQFQIMRNPQVVLQYDTDQDGNSPKMVQATLVERMMNLGFTERVAQSTLKRYDISHIEGNISVVEQRISQGDIDSPAALLHAALRDDYRAPSIKAQPLSVEEKSQDEIKNRKEYGLGILEESFNINSQTMAWEAYQNLTQDEQEAIQNEFLQRNKNNRFLLERMRRNGLLSPPTKGVFLIYLRETLLKHAWQKTFSAYLDFLNSQTDLDPKLRQALFWAKEQA